MAVTEAQVREALSRVIEPELHRDLITLDMVRDIRIEDADVTFTIVLTTPACPLKKEIEASARGELSRIAGLGSVTVQWDAKVPQHRGGGSGKQAVPGVSNIFAVTSGKGGVGKTTISVNLAVALAQSGAKVGICDCDIYGPNVPLMMGIHGTPRAAGNRIVPMVNYDVKIMSMAFLTGEDTPLIWRGPMVHSAIRQFLFQTDWGELDYLVIDLPPGTGDAQLTLVQAVPLMGGLVVTTPQDVSLLDAKKAIMMFRQVNVPVLGIVENMSGFACPHCGTVSPIFSEGGGRQTAEKYGVPFLGAVPIELEVRSGGDEGRPIALREPPSAAAQALQELTRRTAAQISVQNLTGAPLPVIQ
ncbi:MAG TPA: Mrp/NBP35 family ATP-binding protein, partial [Acidobacteriota bacterium]